jgi:carboxymethylenebutenolidase
MTAPDPPASYDPAKEQQVGGNVGEFKTVEAGGTPLRLYMSGNMAPGTPGVVLLHAWWGLNDDVVAYAERLGAAGFAVVAPDMFGGQIASTIDEAEKLSGSSNEEAIQGIVLATVDTLAERLGPTSKIVALGFSFGAAWAIWTPTRSDRLAATVVYYGTWVEDAVLAGSRVPVLGHFAEDDPYEDAATVEAFEKGLKDAGREATIYRYPGTGHWFAEPSKEAYRAQAADLAFERTVDFLGRELGKPAG